ncbi:MAG: type II secretion system protein [Pseudomonadales bacterium]|nr:type II secretion system protein [Pseudomonadales bacterium]
MDGLKQGGFTLIELIMVITLLAILSVSVGGKFASNNAFSVLSAKNQLLASFLLAQQQALGNADDSLPISLRLLQTADEWQIDICKGVRTSDLCQNPAQIIYANAMQRDAASLTLNGVVFPSSQTFDLDSNANLNPRTINYRFDFIATNTQTLCLSTSGYAFAQTGLCPWD